MKADFNCWEINMAAPMDLSIAKKNLSEVLGDGMKLYLQILRSWFKQKITREDFDHEARKLMSPETVHLHNQFLLAILGKCQILGSSLVVRDSNNSTSNNQHTSHSSKLAKKLKKRKVSSNKPSFHQRHVAADPLVIAPQIPIHIPDPEERGPGFMSREMVLPDIGMVHGRMIVSAWDFGLEDVQDDAVRLLMQAIDMQLKNIITAVLTRRNGYRMRDKKFKYAVGVQVPSPHLRNTILNQDSSVESPVMSVTSKGVHMPTMRPSVETGERDAAVHMALSHTTSASRGPVSLFDLFEALQTSKSAIPSHTVYTNCMERIINKMYHPSNEEFSHSNLQKHEQNAKHELHARQIAVKTS